MADFRLGRLKFNWRGAWAASTAYVIDDIVSFKGNTYVCVVNHTSASDETSWATTDLNIGTPRWQLHTPGVRYMGAWTASTFYAVNDIVSYGANQYLCTTDHTADASEQNFYTNDLANWSLYTESTTYKGLWSAGVWYKANDIAKYGNTLYIVTTPHLSSVVFDATKFGVYLESFNFENTWGVGTEYQPGDVVTYGGYSYISQTINTGLQPNLNDSDWKILTTGFTVQGEYDASVVYVPGDVVQFGGNTFVREVSGNAGEAPVPTTDAQGNVSYSGWNLVTEGLSFKSNWASSSTYQIHDVVKKGTGSYVCLTANNLNIDPETDNGTNWQALSQGESTLSLALPGDILIRNSNANVPLAIGNEGDILTVADTGLPAWERNNWCANVYYVATDGTDDPDFGKNISKPWRTLRYALTQTANQGTSDNIVTIFVKSGAYEEQLPLQTTPFTSIVGDNLRATVIKPDPNTQSTDSVPVENRFSTMFILSEAVTLKDLVMNGMEGFEPAAGSNNAWDVTQATVRGVFLRLDPNTPITTKSPYITQCSAFSGRPQSADLYSGGGLGALIDKSIYGSTTSNGSMLFDSFTQFHDNGVGFWCKDLGNAEIVSSFTYYCAIGYTCTGGGRIRSLAGNNSYGQYGAVSSGTDANETPLTGTIRGQRLDFGYDENSAKFKKLEQVVQGTADTIDQNTPGSGTTLISEANQTYTAVATTSSGTGTGATFTVVRDGNGAVTSVTPVSRGTGYAISEVVTIDGALIGGSSTTDDILIQVDTVIDDFATTNDNYALALVLYTQESGEDGSGEDYLLIEPITGLFTDGKPIKGISSAEVVGSGATGNTASANALGGIKGKIFTLTGLPVDSNNDAILPKPTGSTAFLGAPADTGYYVIQNVTDPDTAQTLTLSTLRQRDVPGTAPVGVEIDTISYANNTVTINTSAAHGLSTGDEVVVVIANAVYQPYGSSPFERETVSITSGTEFTYTKTGLNDISPAIVLGGSKVYLQNTSGGSTKALHPGGSSIDLYNVSNQTTRLDRAGTQELDTTTTAITFQDTAILSSMTAGSNNFIMLGNELMEITQVNAGLGVDVVRGSEGTSAATHADGSVVYYVTKSAGATTTRSDIDTSVTTVPVFSISNFDAEDVVKIGNEFFRVTSVNSTLVGQATITFSQPKTLAGAAGQAFEIRMNYSQVRLTGHDFLLVGTGNKEQTNWPDAPLQDANQENEVKEDFPGRVYYVSTDQDGNFRVGTFFRVEQATGAATLDANAFDLSGLASLRLGTIGAQLGAAINEFSTDTTLGGDFSRDSACPTQLAVKTYVDGQTGGGLSREAITLGVSSLSSSGTTATVTTFTPNNVFQGDEVVVEGADQANYNGRFTVTSIDLANNSFTYSMSGTAAGTATGAFTVRRVQRMSDELDIQGNLKVRPTWDNSQEVFNSIHIDITDTNSQVTSNIIEAKVDGASKFNVDKDGNVTAAGDLTVAGTTTTVNSTNLSISDKEIILANGATDAAASNGAGIKLGTTSIGFLYNDNSGVNPRWDLTGGLNVSGTQGIYIAGTSALSSTTLGTGIVNSSLTSLGTLTGLAVEGLSALRTVSEDIVALNSATGLVTHDYSESSIFYHTAIAGNFTVNLTNVPTTSEKAYSIALILNQGATGYLPNAFSIDSGSPITINWSNGAVPVPNASKIDIVAFSIVNISGTYVVYGQLSSFG